VARDASADRGGSLRDGSRATAGRATSRLQDGLVVVQLALALVLFVAAGLLGHSLWRLMDVPTGFDARPVLTARVSLPQSRYGESAQVHAFYDALFDRLAALPGVVAVGGTWALPFGDTYGSSSRLPTDGARSWDDAASVRSGARSRRLLRRARHAHRAGTGFTGQERVGQPAVAVINETLARRFWPGENPVGRQLRGATRTIPRPPSSGWSPT
jgi:putative ABC transport system permease protein